MDKKNRATISGKAEKVAGCWALTCLALSLFVAGSWAGEMVTIGALLTDPGPHNLRVVTVEGVISEHQLQDVPVNLLGIGQCNQQFKIADGTGSITVYHPSLCKLGTQTVVVLKDGDHVMIDAHFTAPIGGAPYLTVKSVSRITH